MVLTTAASRGYQYLRKVVACVERRSVFHVPGACLLADLLPLRAEVALFLSSTLPPTLFLLNELFILEISEGGIIFAHCSRAY